MAKLKAYRCDRCGVEYIEEPAIGGHLKMERLYRSELTSMAYPAYVEIDLCCGCMDAFLGFMDEMKQDPAACLPDDPENYIPDSYEMMRGGVNPLALPDDEPDMIDDILEGME